MDLVIQLLIERSHTELNPWRIAWISDAGRIVECGSHKHLLETDGYYAESWKAEM